MAAALSEILVKGPESLETVVHVGEAWTVADVKAALCALEPDSFPAGHTIVLQGANGDLNDVWHLRNSNVKQGGTIRATVSRTAGPVVDYRVLSRAIRSALLTGGDDDSVRADRWGSALAPAADFDGALSTHVEYPQSQPQFSSLPTPYARERPPARGPGRVLRRAYVAEIDRCQFRVLHRMEGRWAGDVEIQSYSYGPSGFWGDVGAQAGAAGAADGAAPDFGSDMLHVGDEDEEPERLEGPDMMRFVRDGSAREGAEALVTQRAGQVVAAGVPRAQPASPPLAGADREQVVPAAASPASERVVGYRNHAGGEAVVARDDGDAGAIVEHRHATEPGTLSRQPQAYWHSKPRGGRRTFETRSCYSELVWSPSLRAWREHQTMARSDGSTATQTLRFHPAGDGQCKVAGEGSGLWLEAGIRLEEVGDSVLILTALSLASGKPLLVEVITLVDDYRRTRTVQRFSSDGALLDTFTIRERRVIDAFSGAVAPYGGGAPGPAQPQRQVPPAWHHPHARGDEVAVAQPSEVAVRDTEAVVPAEAQDSPAGPRNLGNPSNGDLPALARASSGHFAQGDGE